MCSQLIFRVDELRKPLTYRLFDMAIVHKISEAGSGPAGNRQVYVNELIKGWDDWSYGVEVCMQDCDSHGCQITSIQCTWRDPARHPAYAQGHDPNTKTGEPCQVSCVLNYIGAHGILQYLHIRSLRLSHGPRRMYLVTPVGIPCLSV